MYTIITMSNNKGQPYVPWKGNSTNNIVPTWSRPLQPTESIQNGASFKARPIKHWRKQLNPAPYSGNGNSAVGIPFNRPGSEVFLGTDSTNNCVSCIDQNSKTTKSVIVGEKNTTFFTNVDDKFYDSVKEKMVCVACNPQANVIKTGSTLINKNYYSESSNYLKSRCKTYTQKLSGNPVPGIVYMNGANHVWPSDSPNGSQNRLTIDCSKGCQTGNATAAVTIYKPNNNQYATQGAVDSSDRITRLKMNTINKNGGSFLNAWGASAANAGGYNGDSDAPYFVKSLKNQPGCVTFRRNGKKNIC